MRTAEHFKVKLSKHGRDGPASLETPLAARDRIRSQWESVNYLRRGLEDMDRSVRIALVVFSVVNAGVAVLAARASGLAAFSIPARFVMAVLALLYAALLVGILYESLRALRAQFSAREFSRFQRACGDAVVATGVLLTLFPTAENVPPRNPVEYRKAWDGLTARQISAELADICLLHRQVVEGKLRALNLIYRGLGAMVIVAVTALLAFALVATRSL